MTPEDLAAFRAKIPGCELVALVDISARTVLAFDGVVRVGQENLDALCDLASKIIKTGSGLRPGIAHLVGPRGSQVFIKSPQHAEEVLCGVFAARADLYEVEAAAKACFLVNEAAR